MLWAEGDATEAWKKVGEEGPVYLLNLEEERGWWRGTESTLSMSGQLLSSSSPRSWRRAGDDDPRNVVQHLPSLTSYSRYIVTGRMHCASCIKIVRGTCMFLRLRLLVTRHSFYWINAQISDIRPIHPHLVISAWMTARWGVSATLQMCGKAGFGTIENRSRWMLPPASSYWVPKVSRPQPSCCTTWCNTPSSNMKTKRQ